MNYLWGMMMIVGVGYAAVTGNLPAVTDAALTSSKEAVTLCLTMAGVMGFWVGLMNIAESAGIIRRLSQMLSPCLSFLFPGLEADHPARKHMAANMIANLFGLGWAATPAGLAAMKELKLKDPGDAASDTMCDFLILNISSLQLIPVNIIAYRSQYGSVDPAGITGPAILATALSTLAAVIFIRMRHLLFQRRRG